MEVIIKETGETKALKVTRSNQQSKDHKMYEFTMYESIHTNNFGGSIEVVRDNRNITLYMSKNNYEAWSDALKVIQKSYDLEAEMVIANDFNHIKVRQELALACQLLKQDTDSDIDKAVGFSRLHFNIQSRVLHGSVTNIEATKAPSKANDIAHSDLFIVSRYSKVVHSKPIISMRDTGVSVAAIAITIEMPLAIFTPNQEKMEVVFEVVANFNVSSRGGVRHYATFIKKHDLALSGTQEYAIKQAANKVAKRELKRQGINRVYGLTVS